MNKQLIALCIAALSAGAISVQAQTAPVPAAAPATAAAAPAAAVPAAPAAPSWSTTIEPTYVSQYMFRGVRLGGNSFEPSITSTYGPWTLEIWANDPISNSDKVPGQSDPEIDPQGSYTYTVNDSLTLQPGFTWYNYPRAPESQGFYKMTFEPNFAVNYTVAGITLTPKIYYDVVLKGPTYEFNAAYTVPLKDINSELDFAGTAGTYYQTDVVKSSVPDTKTWGNYWLLGVSMPFTITKASKLIVGFSVTEGSSAYFKQAGSPKVQNTAAVNRGVLSVSYAYTF